MNSFLRKISSQENINGELNKILNHKNFANAYIFSGPEKLGKKETALNFITEIMNFNNSNLVTKKRLIENNHPDFLLVEPSYLINGKLITNTEIDTNSINKIKALIRVDQVRKIRIFLSRKSIESDRKFILINDAHLLNESASNCLLKTLEEPSNGLFILLTTDINLLLETIKSRCQQIRFHPFSNEKLITEFQNLTHDIDNTIIETLVNISNGSPGQLHKNIKFWKALSDNIKKEITYPPQEFIKALLLAKAITDELDLILQKFILNYMQYCWWRDSNNSISINILEEIQTNLKNNISPRLSWEAGLLKIVINNK